MLRNIDTAGRLYDRLRVLRTLMRALPWAFVLFFIGAFGALIFDPRENLPLSDWPLALAPPVAGFVALLGLVLAALASSGWLVRSVGAVTLVTLALWFAYAVVLLVGQQPGGVEWIGLAVFRLIVVAWIALETGVGALGLVSGRCFDLQLVREPLGAASLIGAPPALAALSRSNGLTLACFVLATFAFALAAMQFPLLLNSAAMTWNAAVAACQGASNMSQESCMARMATGDFRGQFVIWPGTFLAAILAGRYLRSVARSRTLESAADAAKRDPRAPILFLRWFGNDQGTLDEARRTPLRWLLSPMDGEPTIDRMLVEEYSLQGPTIALGNPKDKASGEASVKPKFGVWRDFPDDKDWKVHLEEMADRATAIVMMVDVRREDDTLALTEGVIFELELLGKPDLQRKTLFLSGSKSLDGAAHKDVWESISRHSHLLLPTLPNLGDRPLAAFTRADGTVAVATSRRFSRSDYAMALRWFFANRNATD